MPTVAWLHSDDLPDGWTYNDGGQHEGWTRARATHTSGASIVVRIVLWTTSAVRDRSEARFADAVIAHVTGAS